MGKITQYKRIAYKSKIICGIYYRKGSIYYKNTAADPIEGKFILFFPFPDCESGMKRGLKR